MKPTLRALSGLFCLGLALPAAAEQSDEVPCVDLSCLICPELHDPEQYGDSRMKMLAMLAPGKDNWLFRSKVDFENQFGIAKDQEANFKRMIDTFKQQNIAVSFALQPTRGIMHHDKIIDQYSYGFDLPKARASLLAYQDQLRRNGAIVADYAPLINQPAQDFFFRRDHHWTPSGSQRIARIVADEILRHPVHQSLTPKAYETSPGVIQVRDGTLNLGLSHICGNNFGNQFVRTSQTVPLDNSADALFGDDNSGEVILVGTSNSATREDETKHYNFDGYLKEYLSTDLLNYALPGAGQEGSLLEYLLSDDYDPKQPPKLLIWELPVNYSLSDPLMYRQLIPAIQGGCKNNQVLLEQKNTAPALSAGQRVEVLNNSGPQRKELSNNKGFLELNFSNRDLRDFYVITYYDNGDRDKVRIRRSGIVTAGKYHLELNRDPRFAQANLLSVFIEPNVELPAESSMDAQLCQ